MANLGKQNRLRLLGLLFGAMALIPAYAAEAGDIDPAQISIKPQSLIPMPGCRGGLIGATPCTSILLHRNVNAGSLTITNTSSAIAYNILASIGAGLSSCGFSVSSNSCAPTLNSNASCIITFTYSSTGNPCSIDNICVSGTNVAPICVEAVPT